MSLCFFKHISENELYISGDSRACMFTEEGSAYIRDDNTTKLHTIDNNTLVFGSGFGFVVKNTIRDYGMMRDRSPQNLATLAKKYTDLFFASKPILPPDKNKDGLVTAFILVHAVNGSIEKYIVSNSINNYQPIKLSFADSNSAAIGCYTQEGHKAFTELLEGKNDTTEILSAFSKVYNMQSSCEVGGTLTVYRFTGNGIVKRYDIPIEDREVYPRLLVNSQTIYSLKGIRVTNDLNSPTFEVDRNGNVALSGNITMTGGNITWKNTNSDPATINAENKANTAFDIANDAYSVSDTTASNLKKLANGTYKEPDATFINGKLIKSPEIEAGTITGSVINGGKITALNEMKASCDFHVGKDIYLGDTFADKDSKRIIFNETARITGQGIDMILSADKITFLGVSRIDFGNATLDFSKAKINWGDNLPTATFG